MIDQYAEKRPQRYHLGISLVCLFKRHKWPHAYEVQGQCDIFNYEGEWRLWAKQTCERKNCYRIRTVLVFTRVDLFPACRECL